MPFYFIRGSMETKDRNHGLEVWHMECSDHTAAREDDGDS
jgi:hypothetical protein